MSDDGLLAEVLRGEAELATDAMRAFHAEVGAGAYRRAVSSAYYTAFHAVRLLLAASGFEAHTHDGVQALLHAHFIRPGALPTQVAKDFGALRFQRSAADYDASVPVDRESVREAEERTMGVLAGVVEQLRQRRVDPVDLSEFLTTARKFGQPSGR